MIPSTVPICTILGVIVGFCAFLENAEKNHHADTKVPNVSQVSNGWNSQDADGYKPGQNYDQFKMDQQCYATKEWNALQPGQHNSLCGASAPKRIKKASTGSDTKRQLKELCAQVSALTARHAAAPASDEENVEPTKATKRSCASNNSNADHRDA